MKPKKVRTPGAYNLQDNNKSKGVRKRKAGRPKTPKRAKRARSTKHRESYTKEDLDEAVRLVQEEECSIKAAALYTNDVKKNPVPRSTLADRLRTNKVDPKLGRPVELSAAVEEALVKSLELCASFNYPMSFKTSFNPTALSMRSLTVSGTVDLETNG
jgi:hypothetical protein